MATRVYTPIIDTDIFLKFCEHYWKEFKQHCGYCSRWPKEWARMEEKGLFTPKIIRELYKKILNGTFTMGYIASEPIYYVGVYAQDAAQAYDDAHSGTYKICVITGETALDDDDDELVELSYDEAKQICKMMNDEAEEFLFVVKPE